MYTESVENQIFPKTYSRKLLLRPIKRQEVVHFFVVFPRYCLYFFDIENADDHKMH